MPRQFVGAWRLVSVEGASRIDPRERTQPTGLIIYEASGHMAVQIANTSDRPPFANGIAGGTPDEKQAAYDTYVAYYGTYTVDTEAGIITHHLIDSLTPGRRGVDNLRYFEFQGDRVILMPVEDGKGGVLPREKVRYKITWERLK
jgi:hypothetical protein